MKKILITTPFFPPNVGGPAEHSKNIFDNFKLKYNVEVVIFSRYLNLPTIIRHLFFLIEIFKKIRDKDLIFCFDSFSAAIPTILASIFCNKKVILRIGGDLVSEQYCEVELLSLDDFYKKLINKDIKLNLKLKIKLYLQKFVIQKSYGIIFTSVWQKNIYDNYYKLPKNIYIINNPLPNNKTILMNINNNEINKNLFLSITRNISFKNLSNLRKAFELAKKEKTELILETKNINKELLLKKMSLSRAYICASIYDISPNTVLESFSLNLPCILTKNTGFYELLKDKGVCRFIDPLNIEDIKNAIIEMTDDNEYFKYKNNLKNFIWTETWDSIYKKYDKIITENT